MKSKFPCSLCWQDNGNPERPRTVCTNLCRSSENPAVPLQITETGWSKVPMQQQDPLINQYKPMAQTPTKVVYVGGSLKNDQVTLTAELIRAQGIEVFDDWFAPGPEADDYWRKYEQFRGRGYKEALKGHAAENVFSFDKKHLNRCTHFVLVAPAGKSAHMELGYCAGKGKKTYVLFDGEPERWDVMYQFADDVFFKATDLVMELKR